MGTEPKYRVGQEVYVRDVNGRGRPVRKTPLVKVGRKLVYIEEFGRPLAYRIEDGQRNDNYGHSWLQTEEEYVEERRRTEAVDRLRDLGLEPRFAGRLSTDALVAAADAIERVWTHMTAPTDSE